jgi:hypothetical protein
MFELIKAFFEVLYAFENGKAEIGQVWEARNNIKRLGQEKYELLSDKWWNVVSELGWYSGEEDKALFSDDHPMMAIKNRSVTI